MMAKKRRELEHDPELDDPSAAPKQEPESLADFLAETFGHSDIGPEPEPQIPEGQLPSIAWIRKNFKTKSAAIRYLINKGHSVKDIAALLNVKYQHVRNVKVTHLKRGPNEDWNLAQRGEPKT
jgi:DNA-binding NarL/FixJ family response regulator